MVLFNPDNRCCDWSIKVPSTKAAMISYYHDATTVLFNLDSRCWDWSIRVPSTKARTIYYANMVQSG